MVNSDMASIFILMGDCFIKVFLLHCVINTVLDDEQKKYVYKKIKEYSVKGGAELAWFVLSVYSYAEIFIWNKMIGPNIKKIVDNLESRGWIESSKTKEMKEKAMTAKEVDDLLRMLQTNSTYVDDIASNKSGGVKEIVEEVEKEEIEKDNVDTPNSQLNSIHSSFSNISTDSDGSSDEKRPIEAIDFEENLPHIITCTLDMEVIDSYEDGQAILKKKSYGIELNIVSGKEFDDEDGSSRYWWNYITSGKPFLTRSQIVEYFNEKNKFSLAVNDVDKAKLYDDMAVLCRTNNYHVSIVWQSSEKDEVKTLDIFNEKDEGKCAIIENEGIEIYKIEE